MGREDYDGGGRRVIDPFLGADPLGILCFSPSRFSAQFMKRDRGAENPAAAPNGATGSGATTTIASGARRCTNAAAFLAVQAEFGSFAGYLWRFVGGTPMQSRRKTMREIPASTPESDTLSKDLKKRGFRFVGTTIVYAYTQAVGMVNDHIVTCFRHRELYSQGLSGKPRLPARSSRSRSKP